MATAARLFRDTIRTDDPADDQCVVFRDPGRSDERYAKSPTSLWFPSLAATEIAEWIGRPEGDSGLDSILALRTWIRAVLLPRDRGQAPEPPHP